ncbi:uncharacterized protein LOC5508631 isoform X2 [Nematostella vectensis]|nr:uncharacterized protein LOC5508631 isoform X2 [Nematostella vectensis]XP_032233291.2 uncharacterized protein LOC5508631 isoform X2 [Nematostella vectensis]
MAVVLFALFRLLEFLMLVIFTKGTCSNSGSQQALHVNITCEKYLDVYVDGETMVTGVQGVHSILIDSSSHVMAVKCKGAEGGWRGMIVGDGVLTDESWRCTKHKEAGWHMTTFDDRDWPSAVSYAINIDSVFPWGVKEGVSSEAQFIWTSDNRNDKEIYCRRTLYSPCIERRYMFFTSSDGFKDKSLSNAILGIVSVTSATECGLKCGQMDSCVSFNIEYKTSSKLCELNGARAVTSSIDLVSRPGYQYYEITKAGY